MTDEEKREAKTRAARKHGIASLSMAKIAYDEAERAGLPYAVACAFLMQESGGRNVYGNDATRHFGAYGRVTKANYTVYRWHRDRLHSCGNKFGAQGVGPMQLTYGPFQDAADELGGCWRPELNMRVAFAEIARLKKALGEWDDVTRTYNAGPAPWSSGEGLSYMIEMRERIKDWHAVMEAVRDA